MLWMLALCSTGVLAQGLAFNANPNTAIPDNSNVGADSTITVPNAAPYNTHAIGALQIGLRINHTRNDNLDIYLVPPGVTWNRTGPTYNTGAIPAGVIELSTDNGGTNDNYGSGAGPYTYARLSNTIDPVFTSTQAIAAGTVPYTANIYTVEDTTDFNLLYRSSPVGNWKLVVIDDGNSGQNGTLISWEVRYLPQYYADPNVAIPDNNPNGATSSINVPATSELVGSFQLGLRVTHGNCQHLDVYLLPPWVSASAPYTYAQSQFSGGAIDRPADDGVVEVSTDLGGANFGTGVLAPFAIAYCRVTAQGDGLFTGAVAPISGGGATGRFLAEGVRALHDIYGRSPAGTWTLVLCDDLAGTAGTLVSWQIIYEPVGSGNLSVQRGISDLTYSSIKSGQTDQVLAQFRFDAVGAADNLTSLSVQHTDGVNFSAQFSQLKLVRDNNGDGLYDGGDSLLATQAAPASATVTFGFSQALAANSGVDLLVLGDMLASPVPATRVAVQISAAASVTGSLPRKGIFPVLAGPNIIENIRTFTYRPGAVQSVTDNDPNGVARSIVVGPTSERIRGLRVGVRLDHAYTGDLDLWLLPPGVTWQPPYASLDNGPVLVPLKDAAEQARSKYLLDSTNYERQKNLWAQQIGSRTDLEQRELAFTTSRAAWVRANKTLAETRDNVRTQLEVARNNAAISTAGQQDRMPASLIDGIVYDLMIEPGELATPQKPVAVIGSADDLYLELEVDEYDIRRIHTGQPVMVTLDSYGNEVFRAEVSRIIPLMNERSRTFKVEARFTQKPPRLYPNLTAEASIVIRTKENALLVPAAYIVDGGYVLTGKKERTAVKTGLRDMEQVEVLEGIDAGTRIHKP